MKMNDAGGSGSLMQVIHILGDHRHVVLLLQFCNDTVGMVGLDFRQLKPSPVVEVKALVQSLDKSPRVGKPIPFLPGPHAILAPESGQSALSTDAGTRKKYNLLSYHDWRII